tara:strand:+ start:2708 stop:5119 length:2412 start_codon:yes stop_codon:yes gene_type:complete
MTEKITIFKNIKSTEAPFHREVQVVLDRIKDGATKKLVKQIRTTKDKSERNDLKKLLPAICFSGTFTKRNDASIVRHSGLICLDFDGYEKKKTLLEHKEKLTKDPYTYSVFISPSGNGLKVLVKVPALPDNHIKFFNSLEKYYESAYFDKMCKNVSRVCYESYDPLLFCNPNSQMWDTISEPEYQEVSRYNDQQTIPITDENKIVEILIRWWEKKYPMSEGQRNQNCFILAMAFNDYGIAKSLAGYILNRFTTDGFTQEEITRTIHSAYSNTSNHATKYYQDDDRLQQIKDKLRRGVSKKEIKNQLSEAGLDVESIDKIVLTIEKEQAKKTFWEKNEKGVIKIVHFSFKKFLEDNGFYKFCPEGGRNYVFVKVTNNLIDHTSDKEIKDFILNYLQDIEDLSVYNYFADQVRFFREEFLTLLSTIDIYFIEDTKDSAYLYYQNCAVKITKGLIEPIDYLDLGGYVWKDHIINRKFKICDEKQCDYSVFIGNICANDSERVKTMESTIGYMMHGYKNLSYCPAIILNDEVISDNPEGGTGKGLFMNALNQMKKLVVIDGKAFAFEKSFPYQLVSADTQILCFDDVKKHFDFERLFSVVTEGLTLEKKNKDAIKIPFSKSPKIAITTNYAIKGAGNSFERRKWEIELHQHYNKNFTPIDEFKKHFFAEWNEDEWCLFDNYMTSCLQDFLSTGLVKSKFVNLKIRQLSAQTSHDFIEWCGLIEGHQKNDRLSVDTRLMMQDLYFDFIAEYPDYGPKAKMTISRTRFYRWLIAYGTFTTGIKPLEGRDMNGRWLTIVQPKPIQTEIDI